MQHPETVELTLESIGSYLVRYIYQHSGNVHIIKASERLVESIASNSELVLNSLFTLLEKYIKE